MRAMCLLAIAGCSGASPSIGLDLLLQLKGGGQVRPGPFPEDEGGPKALDVRSSDTSVKIGQFTDRLSGLFEQDARTAFVGLGLDPDGCSPTSSAEDGAWLVPAGAPNFSTTGDQPTISELFAFEMETPLGPAQLLLAGADDTGKIGARACFDITTTLPGAPADTDPEMEVTLSWPGAADLDLHLTDPMGNEAWSDEPDTYRQPPGTLDPTGVAYLQGGILDRDGNANCVRDVFPHEDIVYRKGHPPPSGTYIVRVDARSMCGDPDAAWHVVAYQHDQLLGEARGIAMPENVTYSTHGYGAGTTAFTFTVP